MRVHSRWRGSYGLSNALILNFILFSACASRASPSASPPPPRVAETTGSEAAREELPAHVATAFAALDANPPCSAAGWCPELPSASTRIMALWIGEREIFAAIDDSAVLHWDGEQWHREAISAARGWPLRFAGDPSGVFLVQLRNGVFRREGGVWQAVGGNRSRPALLAMVVHATSEA